MENLENLEGKKTDNLEATSASDVTTEEVSEPAPELNNSPVPTTEEVADANISVEEKPVEQTEQGEDVSPVEQSAEISSDEQVASENVLPDVPTDQVGAEPVDNLVHEENGVTDMPALKTFTQSQVNEMVGNTRTETREKTFRYIYDRYGVEDEAGLDELIGNAQRYDSLNEKYEGDKKAWKESSDASSKQLADLSEQVALMQSGIDSQRYEDAKFILKGKGLDVTLDNIKSELATHPEWQKKAESEQPNPNFVKESEPAIKPQPAEPESKISVLGNESAPSEQMSEEDYALGRLFKV